MVFAVWENTEYENFREIKNFIFSDNSFIAINKKGNQMYSAVLNHYEHYVQQEINWIDIIVDSLIALNGKSTLPEIYNKVVELYPQFATGTYQYHTCKNL